MRGMDPELRDGREQKLTLRLDKDRVMADDWTFNRPKSVSVAKLVGGDTRIDDVETRAEQAAMKLIESQATVKVRKRSELAKSKEKHPKGWKYPERETNNLLYIAFRHPSARDGSPHDHTHYLILNLSFDKVERVFKAVNLKHVDRKAASEVYQKEMRKGLNELGYKTRKVGKEYEITGFPAEVKAKFSQRHESIERTRDAMEQKIGKPMGTKAKGKLSLYDRPEKAPDKPLIVRRKEWLGQLTEGQAGRLKGLVARAKSVARTSRWRSGMQRYVDGLRRVATTPKTERNRERTR
jgi:conjugative relaxase-like TrwC/TraI family protein